MRKKKRKNKKDLLAKDQVDLDLYNQKQSGTIH